MERRRREWRTSNIKVNFKQYSTVKIPTDVGTWGDGMHQLLGFMKPTSESVCLHTTDSSVFRMTSTLKYAF